MRIMDEWSIMLGNVKEGLMIVDTRRWQIVKLLDWEIDKNKNEKICDGMGETLVTAGELVSIWDINDVPHVVQQLDLGDNQFKGIYCTINNRGFLVISQDGQINRLESRNC